MYFVHKYLCRAIAQWGGNDCERIESSIEWNWWYNTSTTGL
jgi:hypothetical protein